MNTKTTKPPVKAGEGADLSGADSIDGGAADTSLNTVEGGGGADTVDGADATFVLSSDATGGRALNLAETLPPTKPYLTTAPSETHGGQGSWHDLTDEDFAAAPEGLLVEPTPDQLALRRT